MSYLYDIFNRQGMSKTDFYVVFVQSANGEGFAKIFSNRRLLAKHLKRSYHTLTNWFIRDGKTWVDLEDGTKVIRAFDFERGTRDVKRWDKGHNRNI